MKINKFYLKKTDLSILEHYVIKRRRFVFIRLTKIIASSLIEANFEKSLL